MKGDVYLSYVCVYSRPPLWSKNQRNTPILIKLLPQLTYLSLIPSKATAMIDFNDGVSIKQTFMYIHQSIHIKSLHN